jgi:hypothetical protein
MELKNSFIDRKIITPITTKVGEMIKSASEFPIISIRQGVRQGIRYTFKALKFLVLNTPIAPIAIKNNLSFPSPKNELEEPSLEIKADFPTKLLPNEAANSLYRSGC